MIYNLKNSSASNQDLAVHPGQDIEYVVVDDEKQSRERVTLAHEEIEPYNPSYYETELVGAVESVLSPLGWVRTEIQREIAETQGPNLAAFTKSGKLTNTIEISGCLLVNVERIHRLEAGE